MVNNGASSGCQACRRRKIKCDKSQPSCQECLRRNEPCPGYANQLRFRSQNERLELKYQESRLRQSGMIQVLKRHCAELSQYLSADVHTQALNLFFADYVLLPIPKISPGWLSRLPGLFCNADEVSVLRHAVRAAAYASFARKFSNASLSLEGVEHNLKAISLVKSILTMSQPSIGDDVMTAVLVLVHYEYISATRSEELSLHHSLGLGVLGRLWHTSQAEHQEPDLLQVVCCQTQRRNLDLGLAPTQEDETLLALLNQQALSSRMAVLIHAVGMFVAESKLEPGTVSSAFPTREVSALEGRLRDWFEQAHSVTGVLTDPRSKDFDPSNPTALSTYRDLWLLSSWNKGRTLRILIHQTSLSATEFSPESSDGLSLLTSRSNSESLEIINQMINEILESVPFSLGESTDHKHKTPQSLGGYFLIWSLKVIIFCPFTSEAQRQTTTAVLSRIGAECGIGFAASLAREGGHGRSLVP